MDAARWRCALLAEALQRATSARSARLKVRQPHHQPKATSVIFLFIDGGVSHVDSFDPKERLQKESGKPLPLERSKHVRAVSPILFGSQFEFARYGQCGA